METGIKNRVSQELFEGSFKYGLILESGRRQLEALERENRESEKLERAIQGAPRASVACLMGTDFEARDHEIEHRQVEAKNYLQIQYRDIAKMFVRALPLSNTRKKNQKQSEFEEYVDSYVKQIRELPENQKLALKTAYVFSAKVPKEEREDFYQELALCLLKNGTRDEKLAYTITRCNWLDFWRDYKRKATHYGGSLDSFDMTKLEETDIDKLPSRDKRTIREYITGFCEFENIEAKLDSDKLYSKLPFFIRRIIDKRLAGDKIGNGDLIMLNKWIASKPDCLMDYVNTL